MKRASHGISEDLRTTEAREALKAQDYVRVGELMHQSHVSLRDRYEVSCPKPKPTQTLSLAPALTFTL